MQYMTIIHELIQQCPHMHDRLRKERKLLATMESYASDLRTSHQAWQQMLLQIRPGSDPKQISSEALEIALQELEERMLFKPQSDNEAVFLDAAMLFRRRTPRG